MAEVAGAKLPFPFCGESSRRRRLRCCLYAVCLQGPVDAGWAIEEGQGRAALPWPGSLLIVRETGVARGGVLSQDWARPGFNKGVKPDSLPFLSPPLPGGDCDC